MKKIYFIVLSCALTLGTLSSCGSKSNTEGQNAEEKTETSDVPTNPELKKLAEQTNKQLPIELPGGITMDKASASGNSFSFIYTFKEKPAANVDDFIKVTKETLIPTLKAMNTPDMKTFRDNKSKLIYIYNTSDGKLFAEIVLEAGEY